VKPLRTVLLGWLGAAALAVLYLGIGREIDAFAAGRATPGLDWAALAGAALVAAVAAWAVPELGARDQAKLERTARRRIVRHVFALGPAERTRERTGRIVSTATDGVERAAAYRATFLAPMIASMTSPIIVLAIFALAADPVAAGILGLAVPAIPLALGAFQAMFRSVSTRYRANARALAAQFLDAIQGLATLRLLGAGKAMGHRLADAAEELRRHVMRLLAGNQLMLFAVDSLFSLAFVTGAVWLALWRTAGGQMTAGQGIALVLTATLLLEPLDRIGQFFYVGMGGVAAVRELRSVEAESPAVTDPPNASTPINRDDAGPIVEFASVAFAYNEGVAVLRDVSFSVGRGERVAIIGPSGAGKSTIATLLQGGRRPDSGAIRIAGADVSGVPLTWQRAQLSVVAQHTYLFTGSLRDNLLIADPGAGEARLLAALDAAGLGGRELPEGLDTPVGERGLALSGGQTQRVAIARAFLKDAPVLVLDEPTSQVDLASERAILAALDRLGRGRAVLAISHRASTIASADRVLALEHGVLAEWTGARA
jgi:ABC-type transport system involved in cytochrome bd biosynthesis fused ATPase/permease subunit